jgi:DNA-binding transcriptional LysR family regulator
MSNSVLASVDLNLLVSLDLLLEERSIRAAARRAGVTPSAMSHTLARLRAAFGDELLVRAGRGLLPTRRAEDLAGPVRDVVARARDLFDHDGPIDPSSIRRPFRVVCTDHVSTVLLPQVAERLGAEAPGVDLYVLPLVPETMNDLRAGLVDVAIGVFPEAPPEIRLRRLFDDAFVTVARRGHPRVAPGCLDLDAFLQETHALVAPRGAPRGTVDEVLADAGLSRRVARTFPSFLAALWHVAGSDDLLTVSARLVAAVGPTLDLVALAPPLPLPGYAMHLAWHPRVDKSPEDAWFRSVLVEAAGALPPLASPGR